MDSLRGLKWEWHKLHNNFIPVSSIPVDTAFVSRILGVDKIEAIEIYATCISKGIQIGLISADQFDLPNIFDVLEYIIRVTSRDVLLECQSCQLANRIADEIASYCDFLSYQPISVKIFMADPSGLLSSLNGFQEVLFDEVSTLRPQGGIAGLVEVLFSRIKNCIVHFNEYVMHIIDVHERHVAGETVN